MGYDVQHLVERGSILRGLGRNILFLGIISFLNDASSEIIRPILPLLIVTLGGSELIIGLVSGMMESVSSFLKVVSGFVSDRIGKRKTIVFSGYLASAVAKLLLSFSTIWHHVLVFSTLERIGKGLRTAPRDAIISESMPSKRGRGFGIHRALDTLGAVVGASLAFVFVSLAGFSYGRSILIAAVLSLLSLIPFIWIRDIKKKKRDIKFLRGIKTLPPPLKRYLLVTILFSFANISYMFLIRRAQTVSGNDSDALFFYILFNISYALFSYPFGVLSDKVGRRKILVKGYLFFSLVLIGFAFTSSLYIIAVLFLFYGIVCAIVDGNQRAFVSDLSPEHLRGTSLGMFHTLIGVTALPAGMIVGYIWTVYSYSSAFIYTSIMSLISGLSLLIFCRDS